MFGKVPLALREQIQVNPLREIQTVFFVIHFVHYENNPSETRINHAEHEI